MPPICPEAAAQSPVCQWAVTTSSARCMKVAGRADRMAEMTMHTTTIGSILG